ncbi:MAG: prolyl oligopeptidase family serine peptidase [Armatimonadota bacterium]|nr:prolyl oligopeptidase family serine peptidase [bacterium]
MYAGLDVNPISDLLAVNESDQTGQLNVFVYSMQSKQTVARIDKSFLPWHMRLSPDGNQLAFGSVAGRIYLLDIGCTTPYTLFEDSTLHAGFPEWSPDGSKLAFSACGRSAEDPEPPHIFYIDVDSHDCEQLTNAATGDRFPQWDRQGKKLAFLQQHLNEPGMPGWVCVFDLETGEAKLLPRPNDLYCEPNRHCWSRDSSHILTTCKTSDSYQLHAIDLENSKTVWSCEMRGLCGGAFSPDGNNIVVATSNELELMSFPGGQKVACLSLANLSPVKRTLTGCDLCFNSDGNTVYFLGEDSCVYRWQIGSTCVPIIKAPPSVMPDYQHIEYVVSARDGRDIPVHRFSPPNPNPIAVELVIGGPGAEVSQDDPTILGLLAAGFEVVAPAYRGCLGYGDEHLAANVGEYGGTDMQDIVDCGLDWARHTDSNRPLALVGYSYGGYLSLLALSQPNAPWQCGIILWSITAPFGVHANRWYPSDPGERKKTMIERSTIGQAHKIKVPIMILHGALDAAPVDNLKIIYERVRSHGIPAEMVIYEDDAHGLHLHYDEVMARSSEFIERSLNTMCGGNH